MYSNQKCIADNNNNFRNINKYPELLSILGHHWEEILGQENYMRSFNENHFCNPIISNRRFYKLSISWPLNDESYTFSVG